jgi:hypothetical protein
LLSRLPPWQQQEWFSGVTNNVVNVVQFDDELEHTDVPETKWKISTNSLDQPTSRKHTE